MIGFISFECISEKEIKEFLNDTIGYRRVQRLNRGTYNTLDYYGEIPSKYEDCVDNELWKGYKVYEEMKAAYEKALEEDFFIKNGGDWM